MSDQDSFLSKWVESLEKSIERSYGLIGDTNSKITVFKQETHSQFIKLSTEIASLKESIRITARNKSIIISSLIGLISIVINTWLSLRGGGG